jgi:AcrR family transcriptional regulator
MAKGQSPRVSGGAAPPLKTDRDRIVDAAMNLIPRHGWRRLSMAEIATEADLPILELYRTFSCKQAILRAFHRRIDEAVLAGPIERETDERPRDRVFDLLMRRFDALQPYRAALEVLGRELPTDPLALLGAGAGLLLSVAWMLEAAGIATSGLGGIVAVKLTAAAYVATARGWLHDESPDLGPTMAALDRRLRGIERWLGNSRRPQRDEAASPA